MSTRISSLSMRRTWPLTTSPSSNSLMDSSYALDQRISERGRLRRTRDDGNTARSFDQPIEDGVPRSAADDMDVVDRLAGKRGQLADHAGTRRGERIQDAPRDDGRGCVARQS